MQHCKLAQERGRAEAFLVYGVREEGFLPEERASTIHGVHPDVVIGFQVVLRGAEYWAVWGSKASAHSRAGRPGTPEQHLSERKAA